MEKRETEKAKREKEEKNERKSKEKGGKNAAYENTKKMKYTILFSLGFYSISISAVIR